MRKHFTFTSSLFLRGGLILGCFVLPTASGAEPPTAAIRPMIWVRPADRPAVLEKIEKHPWARAAFEAMKARVQHDVTRHQKSPDAFLRGLPLVPDRSDPRAHPTLVLLGGNMASSPDRGTRGQLQRYLVIGIECGILHFLTQEERYAACAADILHATVEALMRMKPAGDPGNGGWIYPNDHLYEARALGAQIPILYDFVQPYLQAGNRVHQLTTGKPGSFNFEHAQQVFRTYVRLAVEHGMIDSNWPALEMSSLAHNALALEDPAERARALAFVVHEDTPHQDSLAKIVAEFARSGAVWPESMQYSAGVSAITTYMIALLRRQDHAIELPAGFVNIPLSLARLRDFVFPNGDNVTLGDGPRRSSTPYHSFEIAYALALRESDTALQRTIGSLINHGVEHGFYDRAKPLGHASGAEVYLGPLQLLWFAPDIPEPAAGARPLPTSDALPFAGLVLQRNPAPDGDPVHGLMAAVHGGHYVHAHASGMALELYGAGHVLGTSSGKGTYTTEEHENFRRLFASYNCVIVNGASRSHGGWVNLGINTVETVSLDPAVGTAPVSRDHSFTLTRFIDDKGPGAKAVQERLVGIVRTSGTTGFYVDVVRSKSSLPDEFHDYLYHNVGDEVALASDGRALEFRPTEGRFVPVPGAAWTRNRSYLFPGWHVFTRAETSAEWGDDVVVRFRAARLEPEAGMRLFIAGEPGRDYSRAFAPATNGAPGGYDARPAPVMVIRQVGEAWTRPFAVVYEPMTGETGAIRSVEALRAGGSFAGFKVISSSGDGLHTHFVLIQPAATSEWEDPELGLRLRGRYAVVAVDESGACAAVYLGEGREVSFRGHVLASAGGAIIAAAVSIDATGARLTSVAAARFSSPDGRRVEYRP